jgi:hypothetical protein
VRRLAALVLAGGGLLYATRRRRAVAPRVDLYFEDGSAVTLHAGVDAFLATARRGL